MDRTVEFNHAVNRISGGNLKRRNVKKDKSKFTRFAADVSSRLVDVTSQVEKLTRMVKNITASPLEITSMITEVKEQLSNLEQDFNELDQISHSKSTQEQQNNRSIYKKLQKKHFRAAQQLTSVVQRTADSLKLDNDLRLKHESRRHGRRPRPKRKQQIIQYTEEGIIEDNQPLLQQNQMMAPQESSYIQSRHEAVQQINASVQEIQALYERLAEHIAEQNQTTLKINDNTAQLSDNMQGVYNQLTKYVDGMSGGQWLAMKVMGILILFILFFSIFLL